jgi:hypothetical protein
LADIILAEFDHKNWESRSVNCMGWWLREFRKMTESWMDWNIGLKANIVNEITIGAFGIWKLRTADNNREVSEISRDPINSNCGWKSVEQRNEKGTSPTEPAREHEAI